MTDFASEWLRVMHLPVSHLPDGSLDVGSDVTSAAASWRHVIWVSGEAVRAEGLTAGEQIQSKNPRERAQ